MKAAKVLATGFSNRMTSWCVMTFHLAEFCVQIPWKRKKCVKPLPFAIFISPFFLFLICVEIVSFNNEYALLLSGYQALKRNICIV